MTNEEVQALVADRVAARQKEILESIGRMHTDLLALPKQMEAAYALAGTLTAAGYESVRVRWNHDVVVDVTVEQLPALHKIIGRMKAEETNLADAKKKLVTVSLSCARHPQLTVRYVKKLKRGSKCKIVKVKNDYLSLSCGI